MYGTFHDNLQIAPEENVQSCIYRAESLHELHSIISKSKTLHEFISVVRGDPDLEALARDFLDRVCEVDVWSLSQHELTESIEAAEVPDLPSIVASDEWSDMHFMVDDLVDLSELPKEILELASFPHTSPMTGYVPIAWEKNQFQQIKEICEGQGIELRDGQELFDRLAIWM